MELGAMELGAMELGPREMYGAWGQGDLWSLGPERPGLSCPKLHRLWSLGPRETYGV